MVAARDRQKSIILRLWLGHTLSYEPRHLYNLCNCGKPLIVAYDLLERAQTTLSRESLLGRAPILWRYQEILPVDDQSNRLSLGEGMTLLILAERLGKQMGMSNLYIKDESLNPTASFKAHRVEGKKTMGYEAEQLGWVLPDVILYPTGGGTGLIGM